MLIAFDSKEASRDKLHLLEKGLPRRTTSHYHISQTSLRARAYQRNVAKIGDVFGQDAACATVTCFGTSQHVHLIDTARPKAQFRASSRRGQSRTPSASWFLTHCCTIQSSLQARRRKFHMAVAQKPGTQNGTLVSGNMDQNLRFAPPVSF